MATSTLTAPGTWPSEIRDGTIDENYYRNYYSPESFGTPWRANLGSGSNLSHNQNLDAFHDYPRFIHRLVPGEFPDEPDVAVDSASPQSPRSSHEVFFDCSTGNQAAADTQVIGSSAVADNLITVHVPSTRTLASRTRHIMTSLPQMADDILATQPPAFEDVVWRRYTPPPELSKNPDRRNNYFAEVLQTISLAVRNIQERNRREFDSENTAVSEESATVFSRPPPNRPAPSPPTLRLSGTSEESLGSNDSGYGSASIELQPESPKPRKGLGLRSIFKRKEKKRIPMYSDPLMNSSSHSSSHPPTSPIQTLPGITILYPAATKSHSRSAAPAPAPIPEPTAESLTTECVSCLDDFPSNKLIKLTCHSYCTDCFQALISSSFTSEEQWPPKCCLNPIKPATILKYIDAASKTKYKEKSDEWGIPAGDRVYCSAPNCSMFISPANINTSLSCGTCPTCRHKTCTICRAEYHKGRDCPNDPQLRATNTLAEVEGWRRCYSCSSYVEHNNGCRHMTCRCKAQFCYICGRKWRTCSCTEAHLVELQTRIATQKATVAEREAQSAAEAARREQEERELVAEVEAFERQERERLEQQAEAERRKRAEERRNREAERVEAIHKAFLQHSAALDNLLDWQIGFVAERWQFEKDGLGRDLDNNLETLAIRQNTAVQLLNNISQSEISNTTSLYEQEFQRRLADEKSYTAQYKQELEDFYRHDEIQNASQRKAAAVEYIQHLQDFYQNSDNGSIIIQKKVEELKVEHDRESKRRENHNKVQLQKALDDLRISDDREYKKWESYCKAQIKKVVGAEAKKMDELKRKQVKEVEEVKAQALWHELEYEKRKWAEGVWCTEVGRERRRILEGFEAMEYAREI